MTIQRGKGRGNLQVWWDGPPAASGGIFIRESLEHGKQVDTVFVTLEEFRKIIKFAADTTADFRLMIAEGAAKAKEQKWRKQKS